MSSPMSRIGDIAEGQWGLVTLQQARAAGVTWPSLARQVEGGLLDVLEKEGPMKAPRVEKILEQIVG